MEKKVYLHKDQGRTTTAHIAAGTAGEIGIRGDVPLAVQGDLIVEYDRWWGESDDAAGGELCDSLLVARDNKPDIIAAIGPEAPAQTDADWIILRFLEAHFDDYETVRCWLRDHRIPFRNFHDSNWGVYPSLPDVSDAEQLARLAHAGQKDKADADYIEHPLRVASTLNGNDAKIVALLHDAVEDTFVTREFLERSGYEPHLIEAIEALTKQPDEEGSDEGYERFICRAAKNPLARQVKIADLKDNMDLSRISTQTKKDYARIEKYQRALAYLEALPQDASTPGVKT
jgi:hypothetical protein